MIASHYAEPLEKVVTTATALRAGPAADAESIDQVQAGDPFLLLDDTLGWAWGYAGTDRRVGYVPSGAIGAA